MGHPFEACVFPLTFACLQRVEYCRSTQSGSNGRKQIANEALEPTYVGLCDIASVHRNASIRAQSEA